MRLPARWIYTVHTVRIVRRDLGLGCALEHSVRSLSDCLFSLCSVLAGDSPVLCNRPRPAPVRRVLVSLTDFSDSASKVVGMDSM